MVLACLDWWPRIGFQCCQYMGEFVEGLGFFGGCLKENRAGRCSETNGFLTCPECTFFSRSYERGFYFREGFVV